MIIVTGSIVLDKEFLVLVKEFLVEYFLNEYVRTGQDYCDVQTATGEYSCLQVDLVFARELSYFMVTMYVPCIMIVVVSWFAFWIGNQISFNADNCQFKD